MSSKEPCGNVHKMKEVFKRVNEKRERRKGAEAIHLGLYWGSFLYKMESFRGEGTEEGRI